VDWERRKRLLRASWFAWTLYDLDLKLFTELITILLHDISTISLKDVKTLKKSLGDLFLWGDGFRDGMLERVAEESEMSGTQTEQVAINVGLF
jgi:hypothetical protein